MTEDRLPRRPGLVLLTVTVAQTLSVASALVVAVALPPIGQDLHADASQLQWVIDAFVLVLASMLVAGGVAGDRRGRKPAFLTGLLIFAAGSLWCTLAPSIEWLLAGRVIQAFGPVLVLPASLAIVSDAFPDPADRARAIGLWGAGSGIGLALGPTAGGALVDAFGWRGVFAVNIPICLALALTGWRTIPWRRPADPTHRFDLAGAVLLTSGLGALAFVIIEGRQRGWTSSAVLLAAIVSVTALTAFTVVERRHPAPLIAPALLRTRTFVVANLAGAAVFFSFTGMVVFLSAFLQQVQGATPGAAGLTLLPFGACVALLAPFAGRLTARVGARTPMVIGLTLATAATVFLRVRIDVALDVDGAWWILALLGAGVGLALPPMTVTAVTSVDLPRAGMASAVHNASRQLGQMLGVAVLGAIILAQVGAAADGGARLRGTVATDWTTGLHAALTVCAVLLATAAVGVARLVPRGVAAGRAPRS